MSSGQGCSWCRRGWKTPPTTWLRARITQTLDVSRHDNIVIVAVTSGEVYAAVRAWLEAFTAG